MMSYLDAIVLGAGPYGLSVASYLQSIKGLDIHAFGKPMSFWECNMPAGMWLRSRWEASHISDPANALTLDSFINTTGSQVPKPVPLDRFVEYGRWFQKQVVPELDTRNVARIERNQKGFRISTDDGEVLHARRVVVATGIAPFISRPAEYEHLPRHLAAHSADHQDFGKFEGRRVVVIGGGQSALESAAILKENGAEVEVLVRSTHINWLGWQRRIRSFVPMGRLLYASTDVGPAGVSQVVARPSLFTKLPRAGQDRIARRCVRPAGAEWLRNRLAEVPIHLGHSVRSAKAISDEVQLILDDGSERRVDYVLYATGYKINVARYPFLASELVADIRRVNGFPVLNAGFESSVAGLHFVGAPGAYSFGPLLRFVSGTEFVGRSLRRFLARRAARN